MKRFIQRMILFLTIFCTLFGVFIYSFESDKRYAFQRIKQNCFGRGVWFMDRITNNNRPIDWAFIGTSRTLHCIVDDSLEKIIYNHTGKQIHALNIGYCRPGAEMQYMLTKELLKHHKIEHLFLEINQGFYFGNGHHIDFGYVADREDIWNPRSYGGVLNYATYTSNIEKNIKMQIKHMKQQLFHGDQIDSISRSPHGFTYDTKSVENAQKLFEHKGKMTKLLGAQSRTVASAVVRNPLYIYYMGKILKLATSRDIPISFFYTPEFGSPTKPLEYEYFTEFGDVYLPPDSVLVDTLNWLDIGHLNDRGAYAYTTWIGGEILKNQPK